MYTAHTLRNDQGEIIKKQPLEAHLRQTAALAASFASVFHGETWAECAGLAHDIGKSSEQGQARMLDPEHTPKVDHATRGAQVLHELFPAYPPMLPFAVCGHHGHLPDGGGDNSPDTQTGTLSARLRKQVPDCADFLRNWTLPVPARPPLAPYDGRALQRFSLAFFTRMIHSCLVDADFLDTEAFMNGRAADRGGFAPVEVLRDRLNAHMAGFSGKTSLLNEMRAQILHSCLDASALPPGIFTLTVPTGGGKTLASLSFALEHAVAHHLRRVVYAIPYTSILEQTVDVFGDAVGADQVVAHYADAFAPDERGDGQNEDNETPDVQRKRLSIENWDASLIVTTNVQLFESLYASRVSRCRKLHNLASSVIVLDEAQLIPTDYLLPCLRVLEELALNYGATILLMSATQPELASFFRSTLPVREISRRIPETYAALKRARIVHEGETTIPELAERLAEAPQVLSIMGTRKRARELYELLPKEGRFHLSTLMLPSDRRRVLAAIRKRLPEGEPCRLVATSLIEAGVDVDFPVGWREETGLDSLLQAAGRVNREGRRGLDESVLHVFRVKDARVMPDIRQRADVSRYVFKQYADVTAPEAITAYFRELYGIKSIQSLDQHKVLEKMNTTSCLFPFNTIANNFHLIGDDTVSVVIPSRDAMGEALRARLMSGDVDRALLRRAGAMSVQVYPQDADGLLQSGSATVVGDARKEQAYRGLAEGQVMLLLQDDSIYDPDMGLNILL